MLRNIARSMVCKTNKRGILVFQDIPGWSVEQLRKIILSSWHTWSIYLWCHVRGRCLMMSQISHGTGEPGWGWSWQVSNHHNPLSQVHYLSGTDAHISDITTQISTEPKHVIVIKTTVQELWLFLLIVILYRDTRTHLVTLSSQTCVLVCQRKCLALKSVARWGSAGTKKLQRKRLEQALRLLHLWVKSHWFWTY